MINNLSSKYLICSISLQSQFWRMRFMIEIVLQPSCKILNRNYKFRLKWYLTVMNMHIFDTLIARCSRSFRHLTLQGICDNHLSHFYAIKAILRSRTDFKRHLVNKWNRGNDEYWKKYWYTFKDIFSFLWFKYLPIYAWVSKISVTLLTIIFW